MNQKEFTDHASRMMDACHKLLVVKGGEYAGSEDRLGNFKRGATLTGCTPLQVAFIYASKHYDSIATFVRDEAAGADRARSETMQSRFQDLMNYMLLMAALVEEGKPNPPAYEAAVNLRSTTLR